MRFLKCGFILVFLPLIALSQEVQVNQIKYQISIETGMLTNDTAARKFVQGAPIKYEMYIYSLGKAGLYVQASSKDQIAGLLPEQRIVMYRKGRYAYKYEAVDDKCCLVYRKLGSYQIEKTKVRENIGGYLCRKYLVRHKETGAEYAIWSTRKLKGGFSPLGVFPVKGVVLKLVTDKLAAKAVSVVQVKLDAQYLNIPALMEVPEAAFRKTFIP
jgi:hypothetical protein